MLLDGMIEINREEYLHLNGSILNVNSIRNMKIFLKMKENCINYSMSPEINLKISPDITCIIRSERVYFQGKIDIPWACIISKSF